MGWLKSLLFSESLDCDESWAAAMKSERGKRPADDADSDVLCKQKVRKGWHKDRCDGDCPGR